jgi:hypothetical protein
MARFEWNAMKPRLTKPQRSLGKDEKNRDVLYLSGTATTLKTNDRLIVNTNGTPRLRHVVSVEADPTNDRGVEIEAEDQQLIEVKAEGE